MYCPKCGSEEFKIDTEKFPYIIDYGYALTTYKSQGQTYNKVVIDADTSVPVLNDMRNAYVNITRCRNEIQIYTDDKDYLKELAQERYVEQDTLDMGDNTIKQTKFKPIEKQIDKDKDKDRQNTVER